MPPRLQVLCTVRALAFRPKSMAAIAQSASRVKLSASSNARPYSSSKDLPVSEDNKDPNTDTLPNIAEETAGIKQAQGEASPEMEQGTPVQEVVKRDKDAQKHLPKVLKDELKAQESSPGSKRSFSTSTRRPQTLAEDGLAGLESAIVARGTEPLIPAASFDGPEITLDSVLGLPPWKPEHAFTRRYPAIVDQFIGLLMVDGKKATAQKNLALILNLLRTSAPPKLRPDRPLLPGHPPPSWLPLNPIMYLTLAIDSLAPLIRLRAQKGAAGGGASLMVPVPLAVRQRRRQAMTWIIEAASKRKDKTFPHRVADQIIAVVEGRSSLWEKRLNLHKTGVVSRSNISNKSRRKSRKS